MGKFLLPFLFLTIFSNSLSAQAGRINIFSNSLSARAGRIDKWAVAFTPTAAVLWPLPGWAIQPGVECRLGERLSLLTDLTMVAFQKKDSSVTNRKYFRIKPELRWNFEKRNRWLGNYIGLQMSYAYRKWNDLSGGSYFVDRFDDSSITYTSATITSPILTSSIQMGTILNLGEHFSVDLFWGMGTRTIFTNYTDVQNPAKVYAVRSTCMMIPIAFPPAYRIDRTITRFHMNTGLRVYYYF